MKYLSRIILLTLLALTVANSQAQDYVPVQVKPNITYTQDRTRYVLGGLAIDGADDFDEESLLSASGLIVGESYDVPGEDISEVIRRYMQQKLFSNVRIEADSIVGGKIYLHIYLTPQPRISSISYSGVKKGEREEIEKQLGLQVGSHITPNMVDRAKFIIKNYFEQKGFKNASVEIIRRDDVTANNRVLVDINITKNEKIKVSKIFITGVDRQYVKKLKRAMKKTHEKSLVNIFRSKKFLPEKYDEDKGFLIDKMNSWGYRDALLKNDSVQTLDDAHVNIYIDMHQGPKYYLRNVEWVGNTVYPSSVLENLLKMKKGDVYNQELLQKRLYVDDDAVGNLYYNNGYVFYNLDPVEINVDGDSIDLEMRINEEQQATFNNVRI